MAPSNSSPYYRPSNISSLSSYITESYATHTPPCCLGYVAGGGHDWTCRISGHALYIDHSESNASTPRNSTSNVSRSSISSGSASSSPQSVNSADGFLSSDPIEPFVLPPPAYSARPSESEHIPFRELPPTYNQVVRAERFTYVRWVPGFARFVHPRARALSPAELAGMGIHTGGATVRGGIIYACGAAFRGDLTWLLGAIIAIAFLLGFILMKFT